MFTFTKTLSFKRTSLAGRDHLLLNIAVTIAWSWPVKVLESLGPDSCAELLQLLPAIGHPVEAQEPGVQLHPVSWLEPCQPHLHDRLVQDNPGRLAGAGPADTDGYGPE